MNAQVNDLETWWLNACRKYPARVLADGSVRTCPVRISYPSLFEKAAPGKGSKGKPKYKATLLFPKGLDAANAALIEGVVKSAGLTKFANAWTADQARPAKQRQYDWPLRDQGTIAKEGYVDGAWFVSAKSDDRPAVVGADTSIITDPAHVYAGCFVLATIRFYGHQVEENKGVFVGLNGVQFFAPGPKFGRTPPKISDQFDDVGPIEAPTFEDADSDPLLA